VRRRESWAEFLQLVDHIEESLALLAGLDVREVHDCFLRVHDEPRPLLLSCHAAKVSIPPVVIATDWLS
jgi:hypothetical protein